uniref:Uncharacterized protein MANES_01G239500 n=1 Tax=Rhizophora mucronata TaxID=61149 RepID=A0A2P2M1X9_RHIMU
MLLIDSFFFQATGMKPFKRKFQLWSRFELVCINIQTRVSICALWAIIVKCTNQVSCTARRFDQFIFVAVSNMSISHIIFCSQSFRSCYCFNTTVFFSQFQRSRITSFIVRC